MALTPELMEILAQLAEERNILKRSWDAICDEFKVPQEERLQPYVPEQIIDRIKQYVTSYVVRKAIADRDSDAGFRLPEPPKNVIEDLKIE